MKLNLGCGLAFKEGWVNVDKLQADGVDEIVDLFAFPWPWQTSSADEMYAGHLIEHIPHEARLAESGYQIHAPVCDHAWIRKIMQLDGFFAFFAEVWRVLKPGGTIKIVCPHGQSVYALQDPTHTRYIVPNTFHYLVGNPAAEAKGKTFDYQIPSRFSIEDFALVYTGAAAALMRMGLPDLQNEVNTRTELFWNQVAEIHCVLKAIKDEQ